MKFKNILLEKFKDEYIDENNKVISIDNKKTPINIIKDLKYINMNIIQKKIIKIYAYRVTIPKMYSFYKEWEIYAKPINSPLKEKKYEFYFSNIGYKVFDGDLSLKIFLEKFKNLSKTSIEYYLEKNKKENSKSGIYGNIRYLKPGIYPKKEISIDDEDLPF